MFQETNIIEIVKNQFNDQVIESHDFRKDQTLTIKREDMLGLFKFLRDDSRLLFDFLMDLTAVDYFKKKPIRFEVVYHLYSLKYNHRVRIKIPVAEDDNVVDSLVPLWLGAN